jgi:hypothetical protein
MSEEWPAAPTIAALSKEFDPSVIQMKPGSNRKPATRYVSHGSVTKRLNAVCPGWSSRVVETHTYLNTAGVLVCAAVTLELTIPGVGSRVEVGTANQPRGFGDDLKNAMSDALKRCAMRFGVALDLWEDMDEGDEDAEHAAAQPPAPRAAPAFTRPRQDAPATGPQAPPAPRPYTEAEFGGVLDAAWGLAEDGKPLAEIKDYLNKLRHRMSKAQHEDARAALVRIEAQYYAPAAVAG